MKLVPFESLGTVLYFLSTINMALSCIISEIKRDIDRKSRFFHTPAFNAPFSGFPSAYCLDVWCGKTGTLWLDPDGEKCLMIRLAVWTQYRRVTDRPTDRQTGRHHSCDSTALRDKNRSSTNAEGWRQTRYRQEQAVQSATSSSRLGCCINISDSKISSHWTVMTPGEQR